MTKLHLLGAGLLVAGAFMVAAVRPASAETVTVQMFDTPAKFVPDPVKVKVGDTIKWVNKGETVHTATTDPSHGARPKLGVGAEGGGDVRLGLSERGGGLELHV